MKQKGNTSHIAHCTSQKGITLITLVITIIVLLILAGVTINMLLGDNGIIGQAQKAKQAQKSVDSKDAIAVAKGEARISEYTGTALTQAQMEAYKKPDNITRVFDFLTNSYNNNIREVKIFGTGENIKYLPIPKGLTYLEGTVDEGAVVVDGSGNEFVWVPVDNSTLPMFTKSGTGNSVTYTGKLYDWKKWSGIDNPTEKDANSYKEPFNLKSSYDNTTNLPKWNVTLFQEEYNLMAKSVETYGGFYVGRYETSWDSTASKVASVANVVSMTGSTKINGASATWYTFYDKQKALYSNANDSVTSGMIYGSQWDAIMKWMKDVKNINDNSKLYIKDSTDMGWYSNNKSNNSKCFTGKDINETKDNKVKNIYDLAGNKWEWAQDAIETHSRSVRGGEYIYSGSYYPASGRDTASPIYAISNNSSRLQLYIK